MDNGSGQQANRVTRVSRGNRDSKPKSENSSRVTETLATTESWGTEKLANMESWVIEKSANTERRVIENSANMENRVMQDSGSKKPEEGKGATPSKRPAPRWCPRGITKTQKHKLQKMHQKELVKKKEEEERDYWFNHL
jgi:hypothetical protein